MPDRLLIALQSLKEKDQGDLLRKTRAEKQVLQILPGTPGAIAASVHKRLNKGFSRFVQYSQRIRRGREAFESRRESRCWGGVPEREHPT